MPSSKEKLLTLIHSGTLQNIELALVLNKEVGLDLSDYPFIYKWLNEHVSNSLIRHKIDMMQTNALYPIIPLANKIYGLLSLTELSIRSKVHEAYGVLFNPEFFSDIDSIPEQIGLLKNLRSITIYEQKCQQLPQSFSQLNQLTYLSIKKCSLSILPSSFGNLKQLEHLDLIRNDLQLLPDSITQLPSLKKLYLGANQLKQLPTSIGQLKAIEILDLFSHDDAWYPPDYTDWVAYSGWLDDDFSLPEVIEILKKSNEYTFLRSKSNASNQIKALPESIGALKALKRLYLGANNLKTLPDSIGHLKNLELLHVVSNQLEVLPSSIGDLERLEILDLANNSLRELPPSISALTSLKFLNLHANPLNPQDIEQLRIALPHCEILHSPPEVLPSKKRRKFSIKEALKKFFHLDKNN